MNSNSVTACQSSGATGLERTRFFPRQLIAPDDLTQDQIYFRDKMRRHNRLLHGWGVVCGVEVKAGPGECEVTVASGYVLGPYGDEIVIDREVVVDLCREGLDGNAVSPCGDALDPWCSDVRVNRQAGQTLYVAVRYAECQSRPVRVQANGCGCSEGECEYSRIRDSFAVKVLTNLPAGYSDPMQPPDDEMLIRCLEMAAGGVRGRPCPECPPDPWVVLADVTLNQDGTVGSVNCFAHRRYVVSFANYFFMCQTAQVSNRIGAREILVDRVAERAGAGEANVLVATRRPDGSRVYLPAYFTVEPGETVAAFLAREGEREYVDPATNSTFVLRDLYAIAGVDPTATIGTVAEAAAPLESLRLNVGELQRTRTGLAEHLDVQGLNTLAEDHVGAPAAAETLPVTAIRGVSPRSTLGQKVAERTIADVANMSRDEFVAMALSDVPDRQKTAVENQAREVWERANEVTRLSRSWRRG